jgi:TFIIF-interacting CTD phosphatase-like protein
MKLVLDLDHTLIHSELLEFVPSGYTPDAVIPINNVEYAVFKRPYFDEFINFCKNYEVEIITASGVDYAMMVTKRLGLNFKIRTREDLVLGDVIGPEGFQRDYIKDVNNAVIIDDKDYVVKGTNNIILKAPAWFLTDKKDTYLKDIQVVILKLDSV